MADERRYTEEETREIFESAAGSHDGDRPTASGGEGLTLADLTEIGREVGLAPRDVAAAAARLDARGEAVPGRTSLGLPISVGRVVDLPRSPTDDEWEVLVGELRATFNARGKLSSHGGLREWTNGNLHAYLETTETGHRLRLRTVKGSALAANRVGFASLAMALVLLAVLFVTGQLGDDLFIPLLLAGMGAMALASNVLTLPRWAREREAQMEFIVGRARTLLTPTNEA